jgi:hypothetical protein
MATRGIRGVADAPEPGNHHRGFDRALEDAVRKFAEENGPTDGQEELSVTFGVLVRVTNPGRIEGYTATVG